MAEVSPDDDRWGAVVLAGGRAVRLDGTAKATVEHAGRALLDHVLDALAGAVEVVVVGDPVTTPRSVRFVREDPPFGGPVAALLAGRDALAEPVGHLVVMAVDMPLVTAATVDRLRRAAHGRDGAFLHDPGGRRQLAGVLAIERLDDVRPPGDDADGMPLHRLLGALDLAEVIAEGREARDVDTWDDLRSLAAPDRAEDE